MNDRVNATPELVYSDDYVWRTEKSEEGFWETRLPSLGFVAKAAVILGAAQTRPPEKQ